MIFPLIKLRARIIPLSQHNAFEGKHSSVGERSMLGVFQEVAKKLADTPVGGLATFDLMFEGIRTALKSSVQQSIQLAEKNLGDEFAVRVLKVLFLVKYVKEFKPTARNISILLLSRFEADQTEQRRNIEEALSLLERQTLIQRNGEVYEFLTNEEKDVEAEIKAIAVDPAEIERQLDELAFGAILRHAKIKHAGTGVDYAFTRKLDSHIHRYGLPTSYGLQCGSGSGQRHDGRSPSLRPGGKFPASQLREFALRWQNSATSSGEHRSISSGERMNSL
ncbi:hypothetical protein [Sphingobium sp. CFD-1]|uniref:hypothetical protein n=1 Tax=Sphingobium sp. CFD-1 TaxID=2878545 RepID=UPI00214B2E2B|nr:hypothetical protein [Sphingobium sp. CFD-1]